MFNNKKMKTIKDERYNLNGFNEPASKKGFTLVKLLVAISVFLMLVYFHVKVEKKYPQPNEGYVFLIGKGHYQDYSKIDSITFWNKAQAYIGLYDIIPFQKSTTYEFKSLPLKTQDGIIISLDAKVTYNLDKASPETLLNFTEAIHIRQHQEKVLINIIHSMPPIVSLSDVINKKQETMDIITGLLNDQLINGKLQFHSFIESNKTIYTLDKNKKGNPKRDCNLVPHSLGMHVDSVSYTLNANPKIEQTINLLLEMENKKQEQIKLNTELELQKQEILKSATLKEKIELGKYFLAKELELSNNSK